VAHASTRAASTFVFSRAKTAPGGRGSMAYDRVFGAATFGSGYSGYPPTMFFESVDVRGRGHEGNKCRTSTQRSTQHACAATRVVTLWTRF
jgi:hypothetical protein